MMTATALGSDQLLARIATGQAAEADWQLLVERHSDAMRRAAALATGADDLLDDAVQEVLLQLSRCAGQFKSRGGEIEAEVRRWLQRLAINCALNLRRAETRRHRRESVHAEMTMRDQRSSDSPSPEQLSQAMDRLSQDERQVLLLRHVEGLDHGGLASALGVNEAAARKRLSRAHERLRTHLLRVACTLSLPMLVARLDAAGHPALPTAAAAAVWIKAAIAGKAPILSTHLVAGGASAMTISTLVGVPALVIALAVGTVVATNTPPAHAKAPGIAWKQKAKGAYNWTDAANWAAAAPNAKGAVADFDVGLQGTVIVNLPQPVTIGTLNVGDTGGVPGAATTIGASNGKPLTFEGAAAGEPTFINITQSNVPGGVRLDLGAGIRLGGTSPLTAAIASPAVFECAISAIELNGNRFTLEGPRRFFPGDAWHGVNWQIGSVSGNGDFVQNGTGANFKGDCPDFTGTLTINNGDFHAQRLPAVTKYVVAGAFVNKHKYPRGGVMDIRGGAVRPGQATWAPRLNPKATLVMRAGGHFIVDGQALDEMAFIGQPRPEVVERLTQIRFECGMSEFALDNGNHVSGCTTLLVTDPTSALVRQQGATLMMSGDGIRTTQGYWAALGMAEKLIFTGGMAKQLKGAGGAPGSKNRSILPWMTIGTVYHPAEGGFATYDDAIGVHSLLEHDEYDDKLAGAPDRNVRCDVLTLGANQHQTVNSLTYGSWGNSDIGAGSTITITSGALMMGSMGGASIGAGKPENAGTIDFGTAEGVIWPPFVTPYGKDITIGSVIAGSGGVTKSATSTLIITGANTWTGRTCVAAGTLQVGNGATPASKLGDGDVEVANGATLAIKAKVANAIADNATVTLDSAGGVFFGTLDLDAGINETVGGLVLDGQAQPAGTYGGKDSAAAAKLDDYFTGTGILTVTGKAAAKK